MRLRPPHRSPRASEARLRAVCASLAVVLATAPMSAAHAAGKKKTDKSAQPAQPAEKTAAELKAEGDASFDAFAYGDALRAYEKAYELSQDPALLFNRGRALQALGRYPEALTMFERFDSEASPALHAKVPGLAKLIAEVRARVGTLHVTCNVTGAQVIVGDRILGETGTLEDVRLVAGNITVEVRKEGFFTVKRQVQLTGGGTANVDVKLQSRSTSGVLAVSVEPAAARVTVDGTFEGNAPIELIVPAGTHEVRLTRDGYEPLTSKAVVQADGRADLRLTMQPTPSVFSRWWFWTGVGAVVVSGVAIGVALSTNKSPPSGDFSPARVTAPLLKF